MITYKFQGKSIPGRKIEKTIYIGVDGQALQNAGKLILTAGEWQMFSVLFLLGVEQANKNYRRVKVIMDGDDYVVEKR